MLGVLAEQRVRLGRPMFMFDMALHAGQRQRRQQRSGQQKPARARIIVGQDDHRHRYTGPVIPMIIIPTAILPAAGTAEDAEIDDMTDTFWPLEQREEQPVRRVTGW